MEISSGVCEKVISRIFMTREFIMCTFENNFYLISEGATGAQEDSVEILVFTRIVRRRIRADTVELFFEHFRISVIRQLLQLRSELEWILV